VIPRVRPTVLLFDVDGTLLSAGGAGRRALERAFAAHCATAAPLHDVGFNGMTDPGIVRAGLERLGLAVSPALVAAILHDYVGLLDEELGRTTAFQVYPGVVALLDALATQGHVAVGLGTGNVREGARRKLARAALDGRFTFGGFGSDHEDRAELLRIGAARGAEQLGQATGTCRTIVIGDTPRDVAAAHSIGAESLGVATGGCPPEALHAAGATWTVADLTAPAVLDALCKGETT
jgi:phosphoglycolate phosphatase-like HAD superfamily hydrolase